MAAGMRVSGGWQSSIRARIRPVEVSGERVLWKMAHEKEPSQVSYCFTITILREEGYYSDS
jgi:hypothetical protein